MIALDTVGYNLETPCERKARYARDLRGGEEETLQNLLLNNKERFDYHSNQQKPLLSCRLGFVIFKYTDMKMNIK